MHDNIKINAGRAKEIEKARLRGEINQSDAEKHMALLTSETLYEHRPVNYPNPSQPLSQYVQGRINGMQRESVMAIKNGEWIELINRLSGDNKHQHELLMWAGRILKKMGMSESKLSPVRSAVIAHVKHWDAFDWFYFTDAIRVQEMDSDAARRNKHD